MVKHIHAWHDQHIAIPSTGDKEREYRRNFANDHRRDIFERYHFLTQNRTDNNPKIQQHVTDKEGVKYSVSPTVRCTIVSDTAPNNIFHSLVISREIPHRHGQCTNAETEDNLGDVKPLGNANFANLQKSKEHEHRQK